MKNLIFLFLSILIFSCGTSTNKETTTKSYAIMDTVSNEVESAKVAHQNSPNETIPKNLLQNRRVGDYQLIFHELSKSQYDSTRKRIVSTPIPLSDPVNMVSRIDSCFIIHLSNEKQDTICNVNDGEYYEKYIVKGMWTEAKQLLVNFENWEEQHDYLISTQDGKIYVLGPEYRLSPNRKMMLTFVDVISYPIYSNEFILSEISTSGFIEYFNIDFGDHTITSANWVTDNQLLISAGKIDYQNLELIYETKYSLEIFK